MNFCLEKKYTILLLILAVLMIIFIIFPQNSDLGALHEVKAALEKNDYSVEVEEAEKSFLQGERYVLRVDEAEKMIVTVYVYPSSTAARKDAQSITADGFGIERKNLLGASEGVQISWVDAPHFFLYENCIVQYIGMDFDLLCCLRAVCGNQIAGQPFVSEAIWCVSDAK